MKGPTRVGVITPTRNNRPKFLAQCRHYILAQTYNISHVELVDYEQKTFPYDLAERYKYGFERMRDKCDLIVIMEDDDWYSPYYVQEMVKLWELHKKPQIVGYNSTVYYHIMSMKYAVLSHPGRASAMATAIASDAVVLLDWKRIDPLWADIGFWEQLKGVAADVLEHQCLGIKHGLGDCGGAGHKEHFYRGERLNMDYGMQFFKRIVGADFRFYANQISRKEA